MDYRPVDGRELSLTSSQTVALDPMWSHDSTRLAFWRVVGPPWVGAQLSVQSANGIGETETVAIDGPARDWRPSDWSLDERFFLIDGNEITNVSGSMNVWFLSPGNRRPQRFLKSAFNKTESRFSPDGHWVSYVSDESGASQVYVQSFPQPGVSSQVSVAGGSQPRWRRDGKELFYLAADRKLMAVQVRTAPTFQAGVPAALFELPNAGSQYDVTADGQHFIITRGLRERPPSPITVVLNWTATLKK